MGDMADFSLYNDGYDGHDWGSDQESYGYEGDYDHNYAPRRITCKNCGTEGLHWTEHRNRWYLFDQNSAHHVCPKRNAIDVFKGVK